MQQHSQSIITGTRTPHPLSSDASTPSSRSSGPPNSNNSNTNHSTRPGQQQRSNVGGGESYHSHAVNSNGPPQGHHSFGTGVGVGTGGNGGSSHGAGVTGGGGGGGGGYYVPPASDLTTLNHDHILGRIDVEFEETNRMFEHRKMKAFGSNSEKIFQELDNIRRKQLQLAAKHIHVETNADDDQSLAANGKLLDPDKDEIDPLQFAKKGKELQELMANVKSVSTIFFNFVFLLFFILFALFRHHSLPFVSFSNILSLHT